MGLIQEVKSGDYTDEANILSSIIETTEVILEGRGLLEVKKILTRFKVLLDGLELTRDIRVQPQIN